MRLAPWQFALTVTLVLLCAGCGDKPETPKEEIDLPKHPEVALSGGQLNVEGRRVILPGNISAWETALGKPSRTERFGAEDKQAPITVHIWDEAGVVAFERPDLTQVTKVTFYLAPPTPALGASADAAKLLPKKPFPGSITLDRAPIDAKTKPQDINQRLGGELFQRLDKFPFSWNMLYVPWKITAITAGKSGEIAELSIGE